MSADNITSPPFPRKPANTGTRPAPLGWEKRIGTAIGLASLVVVAAVAASKWPEWSDLLGSARMTPLVAALFVGSLAQFLNTVIAHESLKVSGAPIPLRSVYRIIAVGGLAKFIPGGVWQVGSQYGLGRAEGLDFRASMLAWVEPTAFNVTVGASLAMVAATTVDYGISAFLLIPAAALAVAASTNPVRHRLYRLVRLAQKDDQPPERLAGYPIRFGLTVAVIGLTGLNGMLIINAFGLQSPGFSGSVAAFVGAWIIGVLIFPVPGGLGIREGALVLALAPWMSAPEAVLVATASRLIGVAAELLAAMVGIAIRPGSALDSRR